MAPNLLIEQQYKAKIIAGIDEAGRGPLVGPVFAAAVIIDQSNILPDINDSKKLSPKKRCQLYEQIRKNYIHAIAFASAAEIDQINILEATKLACQRDVYAVISRSDIILVDGNMKFDDSRYISIIKGDQKSLSIAAASILAKVARDNYMQKLHQQFPQYGWDSSKGYGTKPHIQAIKQYGLTPHHRKSFKIAALS